MRQQLNYLSTPFTFFDAISGTQNPDHYLFSKYNDKKRTWLRGSDTPLRPSQLGCFASHYLLWEKCVQINTPIIILEDDAILFPSFMHFYENAERFASNYGLVWMQPSRKVANQTGLPLEQIGPFTVKKFAKGFSGTTGYLISPTTAKALLDYCSEWLYPVDNTMDRFYDHKIEAIGIEPACIAQEDYFESSINVAAATHKRRLLDKIRREYSSLKDGINRFTHNLAFFIKFKLR